MHYYRKIRFLHRAWRYRFLLDRAEIRFIIKNLSENDCAIDIGAHKGAYTYWMHKAVGTGGKVFAFEPQLELAEYLAGIVELIGMNGVVVERMALSSGAGEASLIVPGTGDSPGATLEDGLYDGQIRSRKVPMTTIDRYFGAKTEPRIKLIKCDVEGHELEVFKGGEKIITNHKPFLIFECEQRLHMNDSIGDVFRFLHDLGYFGYFFLKDRLRRIEEFKPEVHQIQGESNYVNNFLFSAEPLL